MSPRRCALSFLVATAAAACTPEATPELSVTWDPPLDDMGGGAYDFGELEAGEQPQGGIVGTNDTEAAIDFEVRCDDLVGDYLATCPTATVTVEPAATIQASFRFIASEPGSYSHTVEFFYDDEVVTYIVEATRL